MVKGVEYEALNVTAPLLNSNSMKCVAVLAVTTTSQSVDLETLFASLGTGHYFTLQADMPANSGGMIYLAFGANGSGSIDQTATGNGNTVCRGIPDQQELPARIVTGKSVGTGVATQVKYNYLYYKGSATGYLRVCRSSVGPGQGAEQFPAP